MTNKLIGEELWDYLQFQLKNGMFELTDVSLECKTLFSLYCNDSGNVAEIAAWLRNVADELIKEF